MALTRRTFLQNSAAAASWLACANALPLRSLAETAAAPLRAWVTAPGRRFQPLPVQQWQTTSASAGAGTVVIDPAQRFQSVLGFGGAFTDASCWLFSRMEPQARASLMNEFFSPSGLGLSMGRTCIGASDYSRSAYTFDDSPTPDPDLKRFSIEHDRAYILPTLREALRMNPEMFYFSTPWSPPAWMKTGDSILGGSMRKEYFGPYAEYFVKFIEGYRAEGVPVRGVTSQNEVDTDQNGRMPAALWGTGIRNQLRQALPRTGAP
ncbi:MAG: twin-arginine translocation signal domain-containing protein [Acidobacteriaceae bacterium]